MTGKQHQEYPGHATDDIIEHEFPFFHLNDACHDGSKSADDGQEACKNDGLSPVFFVKGFCIEEVFLLKQQVVFSRKKIVAAFLPKPVSYHISHDPKY